MTVTVNPCGADYTPPAPYVAKGVTPHAGATSSMLAAGVSQVALYGPLAGGFIQNPATTRDQRIQPTTVTNAVVQKRTYGVLNSRPPNARPELNDLYAANVTVNVSVYGPPELLFVSLVGPAGLVEGAGTKALLPGETFHVPKDFPGKVWVNAATKGHTFAAVALQPQTQNPPTSYVGEYPPSGPTGLTDELKSYVYAQYTGDDGIEAFVRSYNAQSKRFLDWFNNLNLPVYTKLEGALLDWVGEGLYGIPRPTLYSEKSRNIGPLNSYAFNSKPELNAFHIIDNITNVAVTSDDVYKRILTWTLYKGDGHYIDAEWIKRRVVRFLFGVNGEDYEGPADGVSVVIAGATISITIVAGIRSTTRSAQLNALRLNRRRPNQSSSRLAPATIPAMAYVLQEGLNTGALPLPYQYAVNCRIAAIGAQN